MNITIKDITFLCKDRILCSSNKLHSEYPDFINPLINLLFKSFSLVKYKYMIHLNQSDYSTNDSITSNNTININNLEVDDYFINHIFLSHDLNSTNNISSKTLSATIKDYTLIGLLMDRDVILELYKNESYIIHYNENYEEYQSNDYEHFIESPTNFPKIDFIYSMYINNDKELEYYLQITIESKILMKRFMIENLFMSHQEVDELLHMKKPCRFKCTKAVISIE